MIKTPKDKVSYAIICDKFPEPNAYFSTYDLALRWLKLEQPDNRPHYIVKRTEHYEICNDKTIAEAPAEDVVPVVRCRNCKHHSYDEIFGGYWCEYPGRVRDTTPDGFCERGEE